MSNKSNIPYTAIFILCVLGPAIIALERLGVAMLPTIGIGCLLLLSNILGQFEGREYKKPDDTKMGSLD